MKKKKLDGLQIQVSGMRTGKKRAGRSEHDLRIMTICVVAGIVMLLMAAGCVRQQETAAPAADGTTHLTVAVTILPQKQFVERIAGDRARVIVLVPPGASPHTHEPTPKQLEDISSASVYVKVGSGIEFERAWMDKLAGVNPHMTVVDSSAGVPLITGYHEDKETGAGQDAGEGETSIDPHIWLSPKNARIMVENTRQGLAQADPSNEAEYRANTDAYLRELDALDAEITREISQKQIGTIMVYHPAWSYFACDYGIVQIPIETDGKDPSPAGIEKLIHQAKADNITVIFASPEYSTKSADVIAREIGGSVALVDPLEEDYLKNIRNALEAFTRG